MKGLLKALIPQILPLLLNYIQQKTLRKTKANDKLFSLKVKNSLDKFIEIYRDKYLNYNSK